MSVQCTEFMKDIHKTCASHTDLICFGCIFMYYMQVLSVPSLCNEGIVNIQELCSIPSA